MDRVSIELHLWVTALLQSLWSVPQDPMYWDSIPLSLKWHSVSSCLFLCLKMSLFDKASNVGIFLSCAVLSKAVMGSFLEVCRPALADLFDALSVYLWSLPLSNCQMVIGGWELVRVGAARLVTWAVKSNETLTISDLTNELSVEIGANYELWCRLKQLCKVMNLLSFL